MEFIDHTGHIFSLPSYQEEPIGYEYEVNPYIFWVDDNYTNKLSINNYYIKPIRIVFDETANFEFTNIDITCDSNIFKLYSSSTLQELMEDYDTYKQYVNITDEDFKSTLIYRTAYDEKGTSIPYYSDFSMLRNIKETLYWYITRQYNVISRTTSFDIYKYIDEDGISVATLDNSIFSTADVYTKILSYVKDENGNVIKDEDGDATPDEIKDYIIYYKEDKSLKNDPVNYLEWWKENDIYNYAYIKVDGKDVPLLKNALRNGYITEEVLIYNDDTIVDIETDGYSTTKYYYISYDKINNEYKINNIDESKVEKLDDGRLIYNSYSRYTFSSKEKLEEYIYNAPDVLPIDEALLKIRTELIKNAKKALDADNNVYKLYQENLELCNYLYSNAPVYNNKIITCAEYPISEEVHDLCIIPFYLVANSPVSGTWTTNILININSEDKHVFVDDDILPHLEPVLPYDYQYCHITVGGVFYDESEELVINGINMGIDLPKDILKSLYQTSIFQYYPNEELYNEKLKEYLLNFMVIKSEQGNFNSALTSLKWFGWGDVLTISKLIQTDNILINQYIHDYFNINNDILHSFYDFKTATYVSLGIAENRETGEEYEINFDKDFPGEGKPILEDLFDKTVVTKYDEQDISFYKGFYDFMFDEMGVKLAMLSYYYQKYFLPIHLKIHSASIKHIVYTNDIKLVQTGYTKYVEAPVLMNDNTVDVKFDTDTYYFYNSEHYVDENYNEFTNTFHESGVDHINGYYINDTCVTIPISITSKNSNYFRCTLILNKYSDNTVTNIFESHFDFVTNHMEDNNEYKNFIIYPKQLSGIFDSHFWTDEVFVLYLCVNDKWFTHLFVMKMPELQINMGKLEYKYWMDDNESITGFNQLTDDLRFKAFMYNDNLVKMYDIKYEDKLIAAQTSNDYTTEDNSFNNLLAEYTENPNIYKSDKYLNKVHIYNLYDNDGNIIKYDPSQPIHKLYMDFFYLETTYNENIDYSNGQEKIIEHRKGDSKIELSNSIKYDCFIMHDMDVWYCVFISRNTLSYAEYEEFDKINKDIMHNDTISGEIYNLKYVKSDNKFLINRMNIKWSEGDNRFNSDDIIVAELNNDKLAFNYDIGSKWSILSKSILLTSDTEYNANTNMAIISMGEGNATNAKSYYTIKVRYCMDSIIQHQYEKSCCYKIL